MLLVTKVPQGMDLQLLNVQEGTLDQAKPSDVPQPAVASAE